MLFELTPSIQDAAVVMMRSWWRWRLSTSRESRRSSCAPRQYALRPLGIDRGSSLDESGGRDSFVRRSPASRRRRLMLTRLPRSFSVVRRFTQRCPIATPTFGHRALGARASRARLLPRRRRRGPATKAGRIFRQAFAGRKRPPIGNTAVVTTSFFKTVDGTLAVGRDSKPRTMASLSS